jgi:hypothetical protein
MEKQTKYRIYVESWEGECAEVRRNSLLDLRNDLRCILNYGPLSAGDDLGLYMEILLIISNMIYSVTPTSYDARNENPKAIKANASDP